MFDASVASAKWTRMDSAAPVAELQAVLTDVLGTLKNVASA